MQDVWRARRARFIGSAGRITTRNRRGRMDGHRRTRVVTRGRFASAALLAVLRIHRRLNDRVRRVLYHLQVRRVLSEGLIPVTYSAAMAAAALAALGSGRLYDRIGLGQA